MKKLITGAILTALALTACTSASETPQRDEKQAFIDATIEATCMLAASDNPLDPALEPEVKMIYEKYGFLQSGEDDGADLAALREKYRFDKEVDDAVTDGLDKCSEDFVEVEDPKLDFGDEFEDNAGDEGIKDVVVEEDATPEEETTQ